MQNKCTWGLFNLPRIKPVIRAIGDYFNPHIGEILIDTEEIFEQAHQFMQYVTPDMEDRAKV